jgi:hypothetical protein
MRLFVRASTVRAPAQPGTPKIYAIGRQGSRSTSTPTVAGDAIRAVGQQGSNSTTRASVLRTATQGSVSRSRPFVLALATQGSTSRSTPSTGGAVGYAYNRIHVIERHADLTAAPLANHVVRGSISGVWLKQVGLTGGRIANANCWDLIFETLDATPVRLDHEIESYDGTNGVLQFALRLPSWAAATDQFRARIRYGATL